MSAIPCPDRTNVEGTPRLRVRLRSPRRERGVMLVEALFALILAAAGLLAGVSFILSGVNLATQNRESADVTDTMRQLVEELRGLPLKEVFTRFNEDPADDPDGSGTALGSLFTVSPRMRQRLLDPDVAPAPPGVRSRRLPITVDLAFPVDAAGCLTEIPPAGIWAGQSWDLDGDGDVEFGDCSTTFRILPVHARLSWQGTRGGGEYETVLFLGNR